MLTSITQPTSLPLLEQIAKFSEKRQQVLAENIAGIDTPGYKSRDLPVESFQQALSRAARRLTRAPLPNTSQHPSLLPLEFPTSPLAATREATAGFIDAEFSDELFHPTSIPNSALGLQDQGKRGIEHEVTEMNRTLMMQNYALQMIQAQFALLEAVIAERP